LRSDKLMLQNNQSEQRNSQMQESVRPWQDEPSDSVRTFSDTIEAIEIKSLFLLNGSATGDLTKRDFVGVNTDWITLHLIVIMIVLAWINVFFAKRLKQIFRSIYSNRHMNILLREGNLFTERISIGATIIYLISFSLFIYQIISVSVAPGFFSLSGYKLFAAIIMIVLAVFIAKNMAITLIGKIFRNHLLLTDFLLMNFIFNVNIGIWLLPFIVLSVFIPSIEALWFGLVFLLIMYIFKLFRQFFTGLSYSNFSLLNRFLYLCTLEIAPFLVLIKLIYSELIFKEG
jgi:hypothetical protein